MNPAPADQQACRTAFGKALAVWLRRNGWSQQTLHDWAKAAGSPGPWNSQVSLCTRGELQMKPDFWIGLAAFNRAVATQDFKLITSRSLRDRLIGSEPFHTADGLVASAAGFFAMFIGEQPLPDDLIAPQQCTPEEASALSKQMRDAFRDHARTQMLSPVEAWDQLLRCLDDLTDAQLEKMRDVLSGWSEWEPDEVDELQGAAERGIRQWATGV
jgi:hypothetical protein